MKRLLFTGQKFSGEAEVIYNDTAAIESIQLRSTSMTAGQRKVFIAGLPPTCDEQSLMQCFDGKLVIVEAEFEESFDMFYNDFGNKRNKINALKLWSRLDKTDKVLCRVRIAAYFKYLKRQRDGSFNINQMYPDTWIRGRHWEDEWETAK